MFSEKLKQLRKAKGLTQGELASMLGMKPSTIGMYEQGRRTPKLAELTAIAEFFEVSTDFLLKGSENSPDIIRMLDGFKRRLLCADGLMFNGDPLSSNEVRQLLDAIEISAAVVLAKKEKKMTDEED